MDLLDLIEDQQTIKIEKRPWMEDFEFVLATEEMVPSIIDEMIASGLYALDLEGTGLDTRVINGETVSKIVGCCLTADGKKGYYIPLRHKLRPELNVSWTLWKREMLRLLASPSVAIFHNGKYDQEMLQSCGGEPIGEWDLPSRWEDTLILAYMRNMSANRIGLKYLAEKDLGFDMIELEELFPKKSTIRDFSTLDPSWTPVLWYAASDALCTYLLFKKLRKEVLEPNDGVNPPVLIYSIEKLCVAATRWMERCRVPIDTGRARELIRLGQKELLDSMEDVYRAASEICGRDVRGAFFKILRGDMPSQNRFDIDDCSVFYMERIEAARSEADKKGLDPMKVDGKKKKTQTVRKRVQALSAPGSPSTASKVDQDFPVVYDVLSPPEIGLLLWECGIPGLTPTEKTGQVKTSVEELERVIEAAGEKFAFAAKVGRMRQISRALSSYLYPAIEDCHTDENGESTLRFNFNGFRVETGRFSAQVSKVPSKDGGTRFPIQGAPSPSDFDGMPACLYYVRQIIGFPAPPPEERDPWVIAAIDYSGVELRLVTNLSREKKWHKEFFHCSTCDTMFDMGDGTKTPEAPPQFCPNCNSDRIGDVHTLTGLSVYGSDAPSRSNWKALRGYAKQANFALCYGGSGMAVCRSTGCEKSEGYRIKDVFDSTYLDLRAWWGTQHRFVKKHKFVLSALGRRCHLPDIDSPEGGFRSQAERNSVNSPIQSTSADIMKLAMGLVYKEVKARGWFHCVRMLITMHDELVFAIRGSVLEEVLGVINRLMTSNDIILSLKWPVPLTTDTELGWTWMVPWHLGKAKHFKKWPRELVPFFRAAGEKDAPAEPKPVVAKAEDLVLRIPDFGLNRMGDLSALLATPHGGQTVKIRFESPEGVDITSEFVKASKGAPPVVDLVEARKLAEKWGKG